VTHGINYDVCTQVHRKRNRTVPHRIVVGKLKEPLARPRHRGADNIKMDLQEVWRETWTGLV